MSSKPKSKGLHEAFARFFENPTREGLREVLKDNVGEFNQLDFKERWPEFPTVAKHILGMGNSGGGCIVVGVEDETLEPKGLTDIIDKTKVMKGIKKYIPSALLDNVEIIDFSYSASEYDKLQGKKFQVIFIHEDKKYLPFISSAQGKSIEENTVYIRRGTASERANYEELQRLINIRLETGYSSTKELDMKSHLQQLRILFEQIDRNLITDGYLTPVRRSVQEAVEALQGKPIPNPKFPKEDFDDFILRLVELKKRRIEEELDVRHLVYK